MNLKNQFSLDFIKNRSTVHTLTGVPLEKIGIVVSGLMYDQSDNRIKKLSVLSIGINTYTIEVEY